MNIMRKIFSNYLRKLFFFSIIFLAVASVFAYYAVRIEPSRLVLTEYQLNLPPDKNSASGMRIVLIADLHADSTADGVADINKMIDLVNKSEPDLVLIAGDFMRTHSVEGVMPSDEIASHLSKICSKYGTLAVLGNHDWWHGGEEVASSLEKVGIKVLENESVKIDSKLNIAGVSDYYAKNGGPDVKAAMRSIDKSLPTIFMTHSPQLFPSIPHEIFLTVAGHTHGGQIDMPLLGVLFMPVPKEYYKYKYGFFNEDGRKLIVTKGTGTSIFRVRFNCAPEVVLITLR